MSEPKWTKGPWFIEQHGGFGNKDPDGEPWPFGYVSAKERMPIFELSPITEIPAAELFYDAQLLAAAPELFEALAELERYTVDVLTGPLMTRAGIRWPDGVPQGPVLQRARTALAKAMGDES